jgi:transposase
MPRQAKESLREVREEERAKLEKLVRGRAEAAGIVERARCILAVANGSNFEEGARKGNRKSGYGVAKLVARFNRVGLAALQTKRGAGRKALYTVEQQGEVLAEFQRAPDREVDGTGVWSLTTLQRSVRRQAGLEQISRDTLATMLHEAGLTWQRNRTWCETGTAVRTRKQGTVIVVDPDSAAKKTDRAGLSERRSHGAVCVE